VLVGRAHLYGLAAADAAGVRHCLDIRAQELRMTMQLCGGRSIAELSRDDLPGGIPVVPPRA
jgi:isopentenyl diphosphate isomerase/L-lactate dehydrogenase-like FMN-dependent dehydrogenase